MENPNLDRNSKVRKKGIFKYCKIFNVNGMMLFLVKYVEKYYCLTWTVNSLIYLECEPKIRHNNDPWRGEISWLFASFISAWALSSFKYTSWKASFFVSMSVHPFPNPFGLFSGSPIMFKVPNPLLACAGPQMYNVVRCSRGNILVEPILWTGLTLRLNFYPTLTLWRSLDLAKSLRLYPRVRRQIQTVN